MEICYLRREFAEQSTDFAGTDRIYIGDAGAFTLTTPVLRVWNCFSWSRCTNHFFISLKLWIFIVWLAVPSKPSSQPIWWRS